MGKHARLSPSSAHRWTRCAASVEMSRGMDSPPSLYAAEGTVAHSLVETCGRDGVDPSTYLDQVFTEDGFSIRVDQEMVDSVNQVLAYVDTITLMYPDAKVFWERKVDCGSFFGRTDCWGTGDITIDIPSIRQLETIDFKYGKGVVVEVKDNEQLDLYTLGSVMLVNPEAGRLTAEDHPFDSYKTTIIQPRSRAGGLAVSDVQTPADLIEKSNKFYHAAKETDDPAADFTPSEKACNWCSFKGQCKAAIDVALQSSGITFTPIDALGTSLSDELEKNATVDPESLSEEQQLAILDNAKLLKAMIESVVSFCTSRALNGHQYAGFKLVEGQTRRAWDPDLTEESILKKLSGFGIKKAEATKTKVQTPTQVLSTAKKLGLSDKRQKNLEAMVVKPKGAMSLAPESDIRKDAAPAIEFKPQTVEPLNEQPSGKETFNPLNTNT